MTSNRSCLRIICCDLVGSFMCPHNVRQDRKFTCISNTCRSYTLWGVLIAISLTTGLIVGLAKNHPRTITSVADKMYYVDWWSNVWCNKVNITTKYPLHINAYLLDRKDKGVCHQDVYTIKGPLSTTIQGDDIFTITLTLNHKAKISAKICMSDMGKLYMFTRRMDFLRCIRDGSLTSCGLLEPYRWEIKADCNDYNTFDNPFLLPPETITEYVEYYFVLYNRGNVSVPATIVFTQAMHNTYLRENAEGSCSETYLCTFNLGGMSESKAVCFENVRSTGIPGQDNGDVQVTCGPRLWLYMMLFLVFPIFAGIVGTVIICVCCDKKTGDLPPALEMDYTRYSGRNNNSSYSYRNRDITTSIDNRETPARYSSANGHHFDNVFEVHRNRDITNRDGAQSLELEPETPDRPPYLSDSPPSYDEVMKGVDA